MRARTDNASAGAAASVLQYARRKHVGACPECGKRKLYVDPWGRRYKVGCWVCCPEGATDEDARAYLAVLADDIEDATGVRPRGSEILADAPRLLAHRLSRASAGSSASASAHLTEAHVSGWTSRRRTDSRALHWLHGRGLTDATADDYELGYDGDLHAITIPIRDEYGMLVNLRRRYLAPDADPKIAGLPRRSCALYPNVPERGGLLFVAGEFDALIGRQMGLPTVTTTCGATLPEALAPAFAGRRVFVLFDVGENKRAARASWRLINADAAYVKVLDPAELGLPPGGDLNDFYLRGGTADDVKALIRRERGRGRDGV